VSCPELAAPVCGADGLTYFNDCLAKFQGVTVVNQGYCAGEQQRRMRVRQQFVCTAATDTRSG
jgi:hypothetical protein